MKNNAATAAAGEDNILHAYSLVPLPSAPITPTARIPNDDAGAPVWLKDMVQYLRESSSLTAWQDLVTELIRFSMEAPTNGVSHSHYLEFLSTNERSLLSNF